MVYKISVIIPCYNSESTLEKCIDSIINQSIGFDNIELILYDDNSSDNTRDIIQSYSNKFRNIVPFYSDINSGFPGTGRNKGIDVASSKYIMFIDNDDEYDSQICEKLYNAIVNEKADIACCGKIVIDGDKVIKENFFNGQTIITGDIVIQFEDFSLWNKIFKKEIISKNNIKFLANTSADDFVFTASYFLKSKKLVCLKDYCGYIWKVYSDSLSHNLSKNYIQQLLIGYYELYEILKKDGKEEFMDDIIKYHILGVLSCVADIDFSYNEYKQILEEIFIFENDINFSSKLGDIVFDIINWFILNKMFNSAIICLKLFNKVRNISILQKIYHHLILKK